MLEFQKWLEKKRKLGENSDPTDRFRFNGDADIAGDYEHELREISKILITRYHDDFIRFLERLAEERNDGELRSLVRHVQLGNSPDSWKPRYPKDQDVVAMPTADRGAAVGEG